MLFLKYTTDFAKQTQIPLKNSSSAGTCSLGDTSFDPIRNPILIQSSKLLWTGKEKKKKHAYMVFLLLDIRYGLLLSETAGTMASSGLENPNCTFSLMILVAILVFNYISKASQ